MKIPVQTPLEQLRDNMASLQNSALHGIATFRTNILTNRDIHKSKSIKYKMSDTREIAIVPYESNAKAVDSNSFAYALESAITESNSDTHKSWNLRHLTRSLFHHPARILATVVIIILLVYIAIMLGQATTTNQQPITQPIHKSN